MSVILIFIILLYINGCYGQNSDGLYVPPIDIIRTNTMIEYVFVNNQLPWNEAKEACRASFNGSLAKIDSLQLKEIILHLADVNYGPAMFLGDYWIGLAEPESGDRVWTSDCSPLTFHSNFDKAAFKANEQCFKIKLGQGHWGESKKCSELRYFMCEVKTAIPCPMTQNIAVDKLDAGFSGTSTSLASPTCMDVCQADIDCWAVFYIEGGECIKLTPVGYGESNVFMYTKACFNVTVASLTTFPDTNTSDTAFVDCTNHNVTAVTNLTENVTSSITNMSLSTATIASSYSCPTTSYICPSISSTFYPTTSFTCPPMTSVECSTSICPSVSVVCPSLSAHVIYNNLTVTNNIQASSIAEEIVKNLTVNVKKTSSHIRTLTSADDKRQSAQLMGYLGVLLVAVPMAVLFLSDIRKVIVDFGTLYHPKK